MDLPDWEWRVIVEIEEREGEQIFGAYEPTRAAAKHYVQGRLDVPVVEWVETYIPRPTWDCPVCGVHEGLMKQPNLRGSHDWECMNCFSKAWGEPLEFDRIQRGSRIPPHRQTPEERGTEQTELPAREGSQDGGEYDKTEN